MDKTYYIYAGSDIEDVANFMRELLLMCFSFNYDYESGTITINSRDKALVNQIIRDGGYNLHDEPEEI